MPINTPNPYYETLDSSLEKDPLIRVINDLYDKLHALRCDAKALEAVVNNHSRFITDLKHPSAANKPPLGLLRNSWLAVEHRINEIDDAIARSGATSVPSEWALERCELSEWLAKNKPTSPFASKYKLKKGDEIIMPDGSKALVTDHEDPNSISIAVKRP